MKTMMNSFWNAHVHIIRVLAPAACTVLIELLTNILFVVNKVLSSFHFSLHTQKLLNIDMNFSHVHRERGGIWYVLLLHHTCILFIHNIRNHTTHKFFEWIQNSTCTMQSFVCYNMIHYTSFAVMFGSDAKRLHLCLWFWIVLFVSWINPLLMMILWLISKRLYIFVTRTVALGGGGIL